MPLGDWGFLFGKQMTLTSDFGAGDNAKTEAIAMDTICYDADINYAVHHEVMRPWGYEFRIAIFDDLDNHVGGKLVTFRKIVGIPTQEHKDTRIINVLEKYKFDRDNPPEEAFDSKVIGEPALLGVLVKRGYLLPGQKLLDLPDLTPATVEKPKWRVVWDFINQPLWGS